MQNNHAGAPMELPVKERRKWSYYFGSVEFFYWFAFAASHYLTVFLEHKGFSVTQVSIINAVMSGVTIVSMPLGGIIADKMRSSRRAMCIFLLLFVGATVLIPLTSNLYLAGFPVMLLFIVLGQFFRSPTEPLLNTTVINGCSNTGSFYGLVRSAGSLSYIIMCLILSAVIVEENAYLTFYILAAFMLPCIYYLMRVKPVTDLAVAHTRPLSLKEMPFGKLFRNPYFIVYILFSVLNALPQACVGSYQPYLVKEVGGNMALIGYIQAYRASFEIPTLLLSKKLEVRMSYKTMVLCSAALTAAQSLLYGVVDSFGMLIAVTTLSGIASGFTQAGAARFVLTLAPKALQASAQTLVSATTSIAGIIGGMLGAVLIEAMGIRSLYIVTGIMMCAAVTVYALSFPLLKRVFKQEYVDYSAL